MQQQRQSTPPQTPPRVAFDPPLFLQRRTAVFDLLTTLNGLPRFSGKLQSLLDVGCGPEGLLLGSLIAPNDSLPLEQVTGIDIDEALWDRDLVESLGPHGPHVGDAGRWRRLGLTLLHGSFESLNLDLISHHDVIVSAEVIEHLDPEPLANYAPVLLGKLKPRVCIVTTPNRDFNDLFSLPFTPEGSCPDTPDKEESDPLLFGQIVDPNNLTRPPPPPATIKSNPHEEAWRSLSPGDVCSSGDRYWRHGVPYGMRHPDHRFEWTRAEFRQWARSAAEEFGYDVTFTGVGGLGNGMCVVGSSGWAIGEALAKGCGYDKTLPEHYDKDRGVLEKASEVWGDCSQIAVFTIREDEEPIMASLIDHQDWSRRNKRAKSTCSPLSPFIFHPPVTEIVHHDFPYDPNEVFPPTYLDVIGLLEKQMYTHLPTLVLDQWSKTPHQLTRERLRRMEVTKDAGAGIHGSDSECDYSWNPELDGDETARKVRKKERRYEKGIQRDIEEAVLGGKRLDLVRVVKVTGAELQSLWDGGDGGKDGLRRLCRFRPEVFRSVLMEGWKATLEAHGRYIGDKAQGGHCQTIIDTTGTYRGEVDLDGDYDSSRRRKMSFTQENSSATTTPQSKTKPNLTSHIFTSFMCDSTPSSSTSGLVELGNEAPGARKRSNSTPPSPIGLFAPSATMETARVPLYRSMSDASRSSSPTFEKIPPPPSLPLQLESEAKMVVKMYCAAASRSVVDLIRRDLSDVDREALKRWKVVKVEYNPRAAMEAAEEQKKEEAIKEVEEEEEKVMPWEERTPTIPDTIEGWEMALSPNTTLSGGFGGDGTQGSINADWGDVDDTWMSTNATIFSDEDIPPQELPPSYDEVSDEEVLYRPEEYGDGNDPWQDQGKVALLPKLQAEFVYSLDSVDTTLSIDCNNSNTTDPNSEPSPSKAKQPQQQQQQQPPLRRLQRSSTAGMMSICGGANAENDLTPFMITNKTLESKDQGVLVVNWPKYCKERASVSRWIADRRRKVIDWNALYNPAVVAANGGDVGDGSWRAEERVLVGWEEWVEMQERNEEMGGGDEGGGGEKGALRGLKMGIVLYRPRGIDDDDAVGGGEGKGKGREGSSVGGVFSGGWSGFGGGAGVEERGLRILPQQEDARGGVFAAAGPFEGWKGFGGF